MNRVKQRLTVVFLIVFLPYYFLGCAHEDTTGSAGARLEIWELQLTGQTRGTVEFRLQREKIEKDRYLINGRLFGSVIDHQAGGPSDLRCKLKGKIERNEMMADLTGHLSGTEIGALRVAGKMLGTISESQGSGTWSITHSHGSSVGEWTALLKR